MSAYTSTVQGLQAEVQQKEQSIQQAVVKNKQAAGDAEVLLLTPLIHYISQSTHMFMYTIIGGAIKSTEQRSSVR